MTTKLLLILLFAPLCLLGQTYVDSLPVFTKEDLIKDSIFRDSMFRADPHLKLIDSINRLYSTDFDPTLPKGIMLSTTRIRKFSSHRLMLPDNDSPGGKDLFMLMNNISWESGEFYQNENRPFLSYIKRIDFRELKEINIDTVISLQIKIGFGLKKYSTADITLKPESFELKLDYLATPENEAPHFISDSLTAPENKLYKLVNNFRYFVNLYDKGDYPSVFYLGKQIDLNDLKNIDMYKETTTFSIKIQINVGKKSLIIVEPKAFDWQTEIIDWQSGKSL